MPVVSQSIIRPIVPVGASTDAWALRQPCRSPSWLPSRHWFAASASNALALAPWALTTSLAAACLRMTRWWAAALRLYPS